MKGSAIIERMIQSNMFLTPLACIIWIPVFLIGVFSLQYDGVSKQLALSATAPVSPIPEVTIPTLTTNVFRVFNVTSGAVIMSSHESMVVPIASIAKLFAGAAVVSTVNLNATTSITRTDLEAHGKAGKLSYGDEYSYQELLFPLLLESSNDAAATINRSLGTTLLTSMNALRKDVGAFDTLFTDSSGFDDGTVSTAYDLQLLLTSIYKNQPHIFDITVLSHYIGSQTGWMNNNPFAHDEGYLGGKHGYTIAAGRTAVALFDEEINGRTYTVGYIILGSTNLKEDMEKLRSSVKNSATEN